MAVPLGLIRCELQLSSRTARNMSVNESHRCRWVAHPAAVEDTSWCWRYGPLRLMSAPMSLPTVSPLCHASGGWECCPRQIQSSPCLLWWTTFSHGSTDGTAPGLIQFNQLPSHKFDHFVESKNNNFLVHLSTSLRHTFQTTMCHVGCCSRVPWAAMVENNVCPALFLTAGRGSTHSSPSLA